MLLTQKTTKVRVNNIVSETIQKFLEILRYERRVEFGAWRDQNKAQNGTGNGPPGFRKRFDSNTIVIVIVVSFTLISP
jgi:hypothetical protein